MDENRVIGRDNQLPWYLPDDLKHFRRLTTGHTVIMGRRNFQSIGQPLRQRKNIIISRDSSFSAAGCVVAQSLDEALMEAGNDPEVFIIGGAQIYALALPRTQKIYLTRVHAEVDGDVHFPDYDQAQWQEIDQRAHERDERHPYAFTILTLKRKRGMLTT
jgi:dihydrofolate reductase